MTKLETKSPSETGSLTSPIIPLDRKIREGLALKGNRIESDSLEALEEHLTNTFEIHRLDESKEIGTCIAYVIEPTEADIELIDAVLVTVARDQNHQMQQLKTYGEFEVWQGSDQTGRFYDIGKFVVPIVLDNDAGIVDGAVWNLLSSLTPKPED